MGGKVTTDNNIFDLFVTQYRYSLIPFNAINETRISKLYRIYTEYASYLVVICLFIMPISRRTWQNILLISKVHTAL